MNRAVALRRAEQLGCEVRPVNATGEVLVISPDREVRLRLNNRRKDAVPVLERLVTKLEGQRREEHDVTQGRPISVAERQTIRDLRTMKLPVAEIAKVLGFSTNTITRATVDMELKRRIPGTAEYDTVKVARLLATRKIKPADNAPEKVKQAVAEVKVEAKGEPPHQNEKPRINPSADPTPPRNGSDPIRNIATEVGPDQQHRVSELAHEHAARVAAQAAAMQAASPIQAGNLVDLAPEEPAPPANPRLAPAIFEMGEDLKQYPIVNDLLRKQAIYTQMLRAAEDVNDTELGVTILAKLELTPTEDELIRLWKSCRGNGH